MKDTEILLNSVFEEVELDNIDEISIINSSASKKNIHWNFALLAAKFLILEKSSCHVSL